jgi:hypothetical protein
MYIKWKKTDSQKHIVLNLESTRPRGISRNIWQDEVREDGRTVG